MKKMKLLLATMFVMTVLMALAICFATQAGATETEGNFQYYFGSGPNEIVITGYLGSCSGEIEIPDKFTIIGPYAFAGQRGLTSITIPDSVTEIGHGAFSGCSALTSITMPDSVTKIEGEMFSGCSALTSITIPDSVTEIGYGAFSGCSALTSITIPDSVTEIRTGAFSGCSALTSITIPDSVTEIRAGAFSDCSALTSITIPDSVTKIGGEAFSGCSALTSITIPDSVTIIGERAFSGCSALTSITIPDSVTKIGYDAFIHCDGLIYVTIGSGVKDIDGLNFTSYKLVEVCNRSSLTITGYPHIYKPGAGESKISTTSDGYIFYTEGQDHYLMGYVGNDDHLVLPNTYQGQAYSIYRDAFYQCTDLTDITISAGVKDIGISAFMRCTGLARVNFAQDSQLQSIGNLAFSGCSNLSSITIPNGVTIIGHGAFGICSNLSSITIPNGVTSIGDSAFNSCSNLSSITIPNGVTRIGDYVFAFCSNLSSITIPNGVTSIGDYAFWSCSNLSSITIPNGVTSIGDSAFESCSNLSSITIPDSITSIGDSAFYGCSQLQYNGYDTANYLGNQNNPYLVLIKAKNTEITSCQIHSDTKLINSSAFFGCTGLSSVLIPSSVMTIGEGVFNQCQGLTIKCHAFSTAHVYAVNHGMPYQLLPIVDPEEVIAPVLFARTENTITLKSIPGYEYKMNDGAWQGSHVFTGLTVDTTYVFYQRVARTAQTEASVSSNGIQIKTSEHNFSAERIESKYLLSAADCTHRAVYYYSCQECGGQGSSTFEYGNFDMSKHDFPSSLSQGSSTHFYQCIRCNAKSGEFAHQYVNYISTTNNAHIGTCICEKTQTEVCSGGTATCTHRAMCEKCGAAYGNLAAHKYSSVWNKNGTEHWHECTCGDKTDVTAHTYNQEVVNETYKKSFATCTGAAVYYKSCVCGAKGTETFTSGTELGHNFKWVVDIPADKQNTGLKHEECIGCHTKRNEGTVIDKIVCDHATARKTGQVDADHHNTGKQAYWYCAECNKYFSDETCLLEITDINTYGNIAKVEHEFGTAWEKDANNHWHECTCGDEADKAAHSYGEGVVCGICGYNSSVQIDPLPDDGNASDSGEEDQPNSDRNNKEDEHLLNIKISGCAAAIGYDIAPIFLVVFFAVLGKALLKKKEE